MTDVRAHWDSAAESFQRSYLLGINDYNRSLLAFLRDKGALFPGARVLDIGCGVGKYGVYFAALGCDVTLTDISERMLEYARGNMAKLSSPWRTLCCDFASVDADALTSGRKFDLTISTMCPAVHSAGSIEKMSLITDGLCFIADFISRRQDMRDKVLNALALPALGDNSERLRRADALAESVRSLGFSPEIKRVPYCWCDMRSPEDAAEAMLSNYRGYSFSDGLFSRAEALCAELADENGLFRDSIETEVVWISWRT